MSIKEILNRVIRNESVSIDEFRVIEANLDDFVRIANEKIKEKGTNSEEGICISNFLKIHCASYC